MTHGAILLATKSTSCYVEALASAALVALVLQEWKVYFMVLGRLSRAAIL
jgi:hypothetical protein